MEKDGKYMEEKRNMENEKKKFIKRKGKNGKRAKGQKRYKIGDL